MRERTFLREGGRCITNGFCAHFCGSVFVKENIVLLAVCPRCFHGVCHGPTTQVNNLSKSNNLYG